MLFYVLNRASDPNIRALVLLPLAWAIGALSGLIASFAWDTTVHPPTVIHASGSTVPSVTLYGYRDGAFRGTAVGVRVFAREDPIVIAPDGSFAIDHPAFDIEEVTVAVPPGMLFVASRNGKKYYSVDSAAGERIVPKNRMYFPDAASAERAGFRP